ncbi:Uncharacterized protein FKW44_013656, partial [Caligus rogercresseyi]
DAKRKRVSDLLDTKIEVAKIMDIVKCSRSLVFKVAKMAKDGEGLERKAGKTGEEDQGGTHKSMNHLSNDFSVDPMTINRAVREDLGLASYTRTLRHLMTEDMKRERLTRCKKVLTWLNGNGSIVKIFSDKKIFTVDQVYNRRNDQWFGKQQKRYWGCTVQNIWCNNDGKKMPPFFFKAGEKIRKDTYYKVLRPISPTETMCGRKMVLHHTRRTCARNSALPTAEGHVALLLAGSEPVGLRRTNRTPHPNVDALNATIRTEWVNMLEEFLINSCKAFRPRVEPVIEAEGGHI